ncbi:MAG: NAD(P)/FAD-dependent oxidoreductase [bacterium]|nr:NAD(P)/FAD-dependent oxidoreductase [bacterium]
MSERYDVIVIGAGHNGLTTAALLAKTGRRVLVVEARDRIGGLAGGDEFHPGYRHTGLLHDTSAVRPWVVEDLDLDRHGLERSAPANLLIPHVDGPGLVLSDSGAGVEGLEASDAKAVGKYNDLLHRIAPVLRRFLDRPPPDLVETRPGDLLRLGLSGLALRRLGKRDMMEVLRIVSMPVADWLNEYFTSDLLKAALAGPAVYSTTTGPRSPGSNANLLLAAAMASRPIAGGPQALVSALEKAARGHGVEIRTGIAVERILLEDDRASGVELTGGEKITAGAVGASCDPKQVFLDLLPPGFLARGFESDLVNFRSRGTTAKVHLALSGYPDFSARPGRVFGHVRTGESLDELERAFDAVKYRRFSERPVLDIRFPTVETPGLAPEGHHVASILVSFAPFELEVGWTDEARERLYRNVVAVLEDYAPGVEDLVVGRETLTPTDVAEKYRLTQGHLFHGEHALDQLLIRPVPGCARYETPVPGLYLCGSGCHPGGGITCAPGALAARVIR